jgi:hypothetical protein
MTIGPPVADIPDAPGGGAEGSRAARDAAEAVPGAAEPVTAALDRLREAASSHDPDSPDPYGR